jgi:hypothetical protein
MDQILVFALFLPVAMSMQGEKNVSGRVYQKPGCNGIARELNMEGDPDLSIHSTEYENWRSANFTGAYVQ